MLVESEMVKNKFVLLSFEKDAYSQVGQMIGHDSNIER